jgi:hypothetical protein
LNQQFSTIGKYVFLKMKKKAKKETAAKETGHEIKDREGKELPQSETKTFDFGGIPSRDLKKNLGCG